MPVLDHETHHSVVHHAGAVYGCWNRDKFKDGYTVLVRVYFPDGKYDMQIEIVPHMMSTDCRFDLSDNDTKCNGCMHQGRGKIYNEMIRKVGLK